VMGHSTDMSPLVVMLFQTFLNPLKILMNIFNTLVHFITLLGICTLYCV